MKGVSVSKLNSDMMAAANLYKDNLTFAMVKAARFGRRGINPLMLALTDVSLWLVDFQAGRIPDVEVFSRWLQAIDAADAALDEWRAQQQQAELQAIQQWYDAAFPAERGGR